MKKLKEPPLPLSREEWDGLTHMQRLRPMVLRWVDHGADSPPAIHLFYLLKIAIYVFGGLAVISATTPSLGGLADIGSWWTEPIVYQKAVVFTMLFEVLGFGCGAGPLMFKFMPPVTAFLHWLRPGTIRQPPWPRFVPLTGGDTRTVLDVVLFAAEVVCMVLALLSPGEASSVPGVDVLLGPAAIVPIVVLHGILGLRDKILFLCARAEMYWIALIICLFPHDQMMIGFKLAIACIWLGAGISKLTHLFPYVLSVMMSSAPLRPRWFKRMLYRDVPGDIRPSAAAFALGHAGTAVEIGTPIVLLFSHGGVVSLCAVALIAFFHLQIVSTIPTGVPNEWNIFMIFAAGWLYWGHADVAVSDLTLPLAAFLLVTLVVPVVLGNLRPDLVSFLPSMRYYAGNWACGFWCFRGNADEKLRENIVKASGTMQEQLTTLFSPHFAEVTTFKLRAFRSLHAQGRVCNELLPRALDDVSNYVIHDGEPLGGTLCGWNFGDGHFHNEQLLASVQRRCQFAEGELIMIFLESQPIHRRRQNYRIVDAATGLLEEGYIQVKDLLVGQPWPDGHRVPLEIVHSRLGAAATGDAPQALTADDDR